MPHTLGQRLLDIREAASDLRDFVADLESEAFELLPHADRIGYRAVKNALQELGEAAKAMPEAVRRCHSKVDWRGFAGLRDVIAHQYFAIDRCRLLTIIGDEVPKLLDAVEAELRRLRGDQGR